MGGGAMRAAARVAGITVGNGGLRGITSSEHHPFFSATRSAISSRYAPQTAEEVRPVASLSNGGVQSPSSEIEDWVFAGGEEEAILGESSTKQRVVFGGAPTHQEAKEATSELAVALERPIYLAYKQRRKLLRLPLHRQYQPMLLKRLHFYTKAQQPRMLLLQSLVIQMSGMLYYITKSFRSLCSRRGKVITFVCKFTSVFCFVVYTNPPNHVWS